MSSSSRADVASAVRVATRPGPRSWELRISAATTRSADESSNSSAKAASACGSGIWTRSRPSSRCSAGWRTGGAAYSECLIASSRPIDPAMESRSDSVQVASASSRSTCPRGRARHRTSWATGRSAATAAPAATGHLVTRRHHQPDRSRHERAPPGLAAPQRVPRSCASRAACGWGCQPIEAATSSSRLPPRARPRSEAGHRSQGHARSPPSLAGGAASRPRRAGRCCEGMVPVQVADPDLAGGEDLRGQHGVVEAVDLQDRSPAAACRSWVPADEHDVVQAAGDQLVASPRAAAARWLWMA